MKATTKRFAIEGPAGPLECALDEPIGGTGKGLAVVCHPHPLHGGTMDNKVAQTLARSFVQLGWRAARFNFRGAGGSGGHWDEGRGEVDDTLAVVTALRDAGEALSLAGFSFGGSIAALAAQRKATRGRPAVHLVLVAPAVRNYLLPAPHEVAATASQVHLIHGEADDVVALSDVLDWARPLPMPVTVIPGAGHFFHGQLTPLKNIVTGACR